MELTQAQLRRKTETQGSWASDTPLDMFFPNISSVLLVLPCSACAWEYLGKMKFSGVSQHGLLEHSYNYFVSKSHIFFKTAVEYMMLVTD